MEHLAVLVVDDVDDADAAERADVERLAAGGGIEARAIEDDDRAAVAALDARDRRVELTAVRIGVIQAVGHGLPRLTGPVSGGVSADAAGSSKKNVAPPHALPE